MIFFVGVIQCLLNMRFAWLVCLLDTYRKRMIIVIIFFLSFHQLQEHINLPLRSTADVLLRFPPGKFSLCSIQRKDIAQEIIRRDSQNREDIWRTWALLLFVWRMVKAISLIINLEKCNFRLQLQEESRKRGGSILELGKLITARIDGKEAAFEKPKEEDKKKKRNTFLGVRPLWKGCTWAYLVGNQLNQVQQYFGDITLW